MSDWGPPRGADPAEFRVVFWQTPWGSAPEGELPPIGVTPALRRPRATYDLLGRKQPHRLTALRLLLSIPDAANRIRRVPARAIEDEIHDDLGDTALISCPCGHRPVADASFQKCPGCERAYAAFGGGRVYVFYLDMEVPALVN